MRKGAAHRRESWHGLRNGLDFLPSIIRLADKRKAGPPKHNYITAFVAQYPHGFLSTTAVERSRLEGEFSSVCSMNSA